MRRFDPDRFYKTTDPELTVLATRGTLSQWRHRGEGRALNQWIDEHLVRPTNGEG